MPEWSVRLVRSRASAIRPPKAMPPPVAVLAVPEPRPYIHQAARMGRPNTSAHCQAGASINPLARSNEGKKGRRDEGRKQGGGSGCDHATIDANGLPGDV